MKSLLIALVLFPVAAFAQHQVSPPIKILTFDVNTSAAHIKGTTNQVQPYLTINDENGRLFAINTNGVIQNSAITNQLVFASTNNAPVSTNAVVWVSVRVVGDTNAYRLPLSK